jgi:hypothetical protein
VLVEAASPSKGVRLLWFDPELPPHTEYNMTHVGASRLSKNVDTQVRRWVADEDKFQGSVDDAQSIDFVVEKFVGITERIRVDLMTRGRARPGAKQTRITTSTTSTTSTTLNHQPGPPEVPTQVRPTSPQLWRPPHAHSPCPRRLCWRLRRHRDVRLRLRFHGRGPGCGRVHHLRRLLAERLHCAMHPAREHRRLHR